MTPIIAGIFSEMEARRKQKSILTMLKGNNRQPIILYPAKIYFRNTGGIKVLEQRK